jgi:hypothetical protein
MGGALSAEEFEPPMNADKRRWKTKNGFVLSAFICVHLRLIFF